MLSIQVPGGTYTFITDTLNCGGLIVITIISCKNIFSVKKVQPYKVDSYL